MTEISVQSPHCTHSCPAHRWMGALSYSDLFDLIWLVFRCIVIISSY